MKNVRPVVLVALCMATLPLSILSAPTSCMGCPGQCVPNVDDVDKAAAFASTALAASMNFNNLQLNNIDSASCQLVNGINYMLTLTFRQCLPSQNECNNFIQCSVVVYSTFEKQYTLKMPKCGNIYHVSEPETTSEMTTSEITAMVFKTTTATRTESSSVFDEATSRATDAIPTTFEAMSKTPEITTTTPYATTSRITTHLEITSDITTFSEATSESVFSTPTTLYDEASSSTNSIYDSTLSTIDAAHDNEISFTFTTEPTSEITSYSILPETSFETGSTTSAAFFITDSSTLIGTGTTEQQIIIQYNPWLIDDSENNCNELMGCPQQCNKDDLQYDVMLRAINFLSARMNFGAVQSCIIESAQCQVASGMKYNLHLTLYGIQCHVDGFDAICEEAAMTCTNVQFDNDPLTNTFKMENTYIC